jgi:hypothetical protein
VGEMGVQETKQPPTTPSIHIATYPLQPKQAGKEAHAHGEAVCAALKAYGWGFGALGHGSTGDGALTRTSPGVHVVSPTAIQRNHIGCSDTCLAHRTGVVT